MCRRPPRQAAGASPARLGGTGHACPRRLPEHTPRVAEAQELHRSPPGPDGAPAVGARTDAVKPAANRPACGGRRRETTHRPSLQLGARAPCLVSRWLQTIFFAVRIVPGTMLDEARPAVQ